MSKLPLEAGPVEALLIRDKLDQAILLMQPAKEGDASLNCSRRSRSTPSLALRQSLPLQTRTRSNAPPGRQRSRFCVANEMRMPLDQDGHCDRLQTAIAFKCLELIQ